ncbi:NUDIX hydrolase [Gardnerella vaginalis]|uniref:Phosphoglycerate mutase family protein n=1 Tax=Gardnerella vaginalis TaxID=2702 RepID=A0A133NP59_GARVA|nr:NUDIX hydrolase [Gardnerella vaginalis]KXA18079.1 phosphoglycerate mutase family protein [Gardnerella vaginalis]
MSATVAKKYVEAAGGIIYRLRKTTSKESKPSKPNSTNSNEDFGNVGSESNACNQVLNENNIELCLVYRPKYNDWSWPKGKNEANESHRHTAVREVGEETGYAVTLGPHIAQIEYPLENEGKKSSAKNGIKSNAKSGAQNNSQPEVIKRIHYWMMQEISGSAALKRLPAFGPIKPAKPTEIGNVIWLTPEKARKKLTHDSDQLVLDAFLERIKSGQANYKTLILVRHGKAESRKAWQGSEATRPITPLGSAASYALGRELACYAPDKIISSPWKRCLETVAAFARDSSLPIEQVAELTEDHHEKQPKSTLSVLISEIQNLEHNEQNANTVNNATVICLHRPVIGTFFDYLREITKPRAHKRILSQKSPYMPTGSAVILHIVSTEKGPKIVNIEKVLPIVY